MFTDIQLAELSAPLNPAFVKEREQSGRPLSYIEGWHAIAEANRIFGFDAWERATVEMRCVSEANRKIGKQQVDGHAVCYLAKVRVVVRVGAETVIREGTGAGHGIDRDLGLAHESAAKEAETDAMKRALMTFGNPFGLALYDKTFANVAHVPPVDYEREAIAAVDACMTKEAVGNWWRGASDGLKSLLNGEQFKRVKAHVVARGEALTPTTNQSERTERAA